MFIFYQLLAELLKQYITFLKQKGNQKERHQAKHSLKQNKESAEGVVKEF